MLTKFIVSSRVASLVGALILGVSPLVALAETSAPVATTTEVAKAPVVTTKAPVTTAKLDAAKKPEATKPEAKTEAAKPVTPAAVPGAGSKL